MSSPSLFDSSNLNNARYTSLGFAAVPLLGIYGGGYFLKGKNSKNAGSSVEGRPSPMTFKMVWMFLVAAWTFSLVLASFRMDETYLLILQIFSMLAVFCSVMWMFYYFTKGDKSTAAQLMLATSVCALLTTTTAAVGVYDNPDAKAICTLSLTPIFVWVFGATLFNYIEINK
jgi:hypothetical protein